MYGSIVTNSVNIREITSANKVSLGTFSSATNMTVKMTKKYYNLFAKSNIEFVIKTVAVEFSFNSILLIRFPNYYIPYLGRSLYISLLKKDKSGSSPPNKFV